MKGLDPKTWPRIEALFHEALELPAAERAGWLSQHCGGDAVLQEQVNTLLRSAERANDTLDQGVRVRSESTRAHLAVEPGARLGRYRILEKIGAGGMGEVYRAARDDGQYEQAVALKLLKPEAASQIRRFESERQFLAGLEHPGIARLIDGGVSEDGRPYMVMEFIDGIPLLDYCEQHALDLQARLALFEQACHAVEYAHSHLIVHRDLKSSNILVDRSGRVKLLDFGVAKLLSSGGWNTEDTLTLHAPLTPDHAAPEQLKGQRITTATDVYALGVVLFRLLTGHSPWKAIHALPLVRAIHSALDEEAPPMAALADQTSPVPARLLAGDLQAIVARALRKAPGDRYATVSALRDDLDRYRAGEAIDARRGEFGYRARRWIARHRVAVGVSALVWALLAAFSLRLAHENRRVIQAHAQAEREARSAQAMSHYVSGLFELVSPSQLQGRAIQPREILDRGLESLAAMESGNSQAQNHLYRVISQTYGMLGLPGEALNAAERGLAQNPPGSEPDLQLRAQAAISLHQLRDFEAAQSRLAKVLQAPEESWTDSALRAQAQAALAMSRVQLGAREQATAELEAALAAMPKDAPDIWRARLWQALAVTRILDGQADEALMLETRALDAYRQAHGELHPRTLDSLASMATLSYYANLNQQALEWSEQALPLALRLYGEQANPTLRIRTMMANILSALGKVRAAIEQQEAVLAASAESPKPAQADAWLNLATDQVLVGLYKQATESLETAKQLLAGSSPVNQLRMLLLRAEIALRIGSNDEASALLESGSALPSDGVLAGGYQARRHLMRAELARIAGDHARAEAALARAQALISESQSAGSNLHAALQLEQGLLKADRGDWSQGQAQVLAAIDTLATRKGAESPATLLFHAHWIAQLMRSDRPTQAREHAQPLVDRVQAQLADTAWAAKTVHQASQLSVSPSTL